MFEPVAAPIIESPTTCGSSCGELTNNSVYKCLALDISTRMGWCLMKIENVSQGKGFPAGVTQGGERPRISILKYGLILTDTSKDTVKKKHSTKTEEPGLPAGKAPLGSAEGVEGKYMNEFAAKISKLLQKYPVDICYIEDFFMGSRRTQGLAVNWYLRGVVYMECEKLNIPYEKFSSFIWKKEILKGTVQISAKERKSMKNYQKDVIRLALDKKYGIVFPEKMISSKTKNKIKFVDDIYDATGQGIYGLCDSFNLKREDFDIINEMALNGVQEQVEYIY
tara:strand:+ start:1024 stop:1863 length:840 start_codon:yes stop_codon:yes gene_type:complete